MAATISFDLIGNAASAVAAFKKTTDASKTAAGAAENTGSTFKKIAGAVATGYAVTKVVEFGKSTVSAAGEAAKANKLVTAVFKDAGDSTGKFSRHAIELADSLGRQIGVSPNVIKGAEGILATFHSVSGATGMAAGVFDRATKAAADLAAAGFGDMETNAKALGKALADPTKGMTALTKSGVNFTQAQKDQIKSLQKSGDLLGAQKIILGEVESQVKGTAAATAGAGAKTGVAYEEMKVKLGQSLLPAVKQAQIAMAGFFDFVSANASWLIPLAGAILAVVAALKLYTMVTQAWTVIQQIGSAVTKAAAAAQWLFNAAMSANPVMIVVLAVLALIAVIVLIATKTTWFQSIWAALGAAWQAVSSAMVSAFRWVLNIVQSVFAWVAKNWPLLLGILGGPIALAVVLIIRYWSQISAAAAATVGAIGRFFAGVFSAIISPFQSAISWISGVPGAIGRIVSGVVGEIARAVSGVFDAIIAPFQRAADFIRNSILGPLKSVWNGFANTINSVSISTPAVSIAGHDIIPAFHWTPPWRIPTLAAGGLLTRSGLVYAHAGEVISPAPASATGRTAENLVRIDHATFSEALDVDLFAQRLAWRLRAGSV